MLQKAVLGIKALQSCSFKILLFFWSEIKDFYIISINYFQMKKKSSVSHKIGIIKLIEKR